MATSLRNELQDFHRFLAEKLAKGEENLSPEEAVDQWRDLHSCPDKLAEDVTAVREALADMAAGDIGTDFEEFDRDFRATHNLPPRP